MSRVPTFPTKLRHLTRISRLRLTKLVNPLRHWSRSSSRWLSLLRIWPMKGTTRHQNPYCNCALYWKPMQLDNMYQDYLASAPYSSLSAANLLSSSFSAKLIWAYLRYGNPPDISSCMSILHTSTYAIASISTFLFSARKSTTDGYARPQWPVDELSSGRFRPARLYLWLRWNCTPCSTLDNGILSQQLFCLTIHPGQKVFSKFSLDSIPEKTIALDSR